VVGQQIKTQLGSIPGTGLPLIIGAVLLLLGARGVANAMQNALCEVWGIPRESRPGFPMSHVWSFALLLTVGALIAAVIWQVLQVAGGYVISHQPHRANELYGTFGVVIGLVAWLYLQAEATVWAAEVDVVLAKGLWPVSVLPDIPADTGGAADDAGPAAPAPRTAGDNESAGGNAPASDCKPSRHGKAGKAA
jgi:uncharacterized BrkB/YihY/UPF0761 family membrane protein